MTGTPSDYSDDDYLSLMRALAAAFARFSGAAGRMTITADIEWAGEYNPRRHRTTTFFAYRTLNLSTVRAHTDAAMKAFDQAQKVFKVARPSAPKTRAGQINWLNRTAAGRQAAAEAGFTPSARTLRRWAAGTQAPSKRYTDALNRAVAAHQEAREAAWHNRRTDAENRLHKLAKAAGDALTAEIGEPVRFFNVSDLDFY